MHGCTDVGCDAEGRWLHDGRRVCRSHGLDRMIRTGRPAVLAPPEPAEQAPSEVTVWDELQAELEAISFDGLDDTGRRLREIAWSAIENGRERS